MKKTEAFPFRLLEAHQPGEWIGVRKFCLEVGVAAGEVNAELFATWLPDPNGQGAYVIILFYDDESKWSMAAQYNRARLLTHESRPTVNQSTETAASLQGTQS
jgi:lipocalin